MLCQTLPEKCNKELAKELVCLVDSTNVVCVAEDLIKANPLCSTFMLYVNDKNIEGSCSAYANAVYEDCKKQTLSSMIQNKLFSTENIPISLIFALNLLVDFRVKSLLTKELTDQINDKLTNFLSQISSAKQHFMSISATPATYFIEITLNYE